MQVLGYMHWVSQEPLKIWTAFAGPPLVYRLEEGPDERLIMVTEVPTIYSILVVQPNFQAWLWLMT